MPCCPSSLRLDSLPSSAVIMVLNSRPQHFRSFVRTGAFHGNHPLPIAHNPINGLAERTVRTLKALLEKLGKADIYHIDVCRALLTIRNTPRDNGASPSHRMFGRILRTQIPPEGNFPD